MIRTLLSISTFYVGEVQVKYTRVVYTRLKVYMQYRSVLMSVRCGGELYLYDIKMVPIRRAQLSLSKLKSLSVILVFVRTFSHSSFDNN